MEFRKLKQNNNEFYKQKNLNKVLNNSENLEFRVSLHLVICYVLETR